MNLNPWQNDQIEPHFNGKYDSGRRQKEKRLKASSEFRAISLNQDVDNERRVDRFPRGTFEGRKGAKEETILGQCE